MEPGCPNLRCFSCHDSVALKWWFWFLVRCHDVSMMVAKWWSSNLLLYSKHVIVYYMLYSSILFYLSWIYRGVVPRPFLIWFVFRIIASHNITIACCPRTILQLFVLAKEHLQEAIERVCLSFQSRESSVSLCVHVMIDLVGWRAFRVSAGWLDPEQPTSFDFWFPKV